MAQINVTTTKEEQEAVSKTISKVKEHQQELKVVKQ